MLSSSLLNRSEYSVDCQFLVAWCSLFMFPVTLLLSILCVYVFKFLKHSKWRNVAYIQVSHFLWSQTALSIFLHFYSWLALCNFLYATSSIKKPVIKNTDSEVKLPVLKCWFFYLLTRKSYLILLVSISSSVKWE